MSQTHNEIYGVFWSSEKNKEHYSPSMEYSDDLVKLNQKTRDECHKFFDTHEPWSKMSEKTIDGRIYYFIPNFWTKCWVDEQGQHFQVSANEQEGFEPVFEDLEGKWHCFDDKKTELELFDLRRAIYILEIIEFPVLTVSTYDILFPDAMKTMLKGN